MEVSVTSVEDVHNQQVVALSDGINLVEDAGQLRSGDHRVVQVVVGTYVGDRPKGTLAPLPDSVSFGVIGGQANRPGTPLRTDSGHKAHLVGHSSGKAIQLHDQNRRSVERVTSVDKGFHRLHNPPVHQLQGCRQDSSSDDGAHGGRRISHLDEVQQQCGHFRRILSQAHGDLGGHAESAFPTDERPS